DQRRGDLLPVGCAKELETVPERVVVVHAALEALHLECDRVQLEGKERTARRHRAAPALGAVGRAKDRGEGLEAKRANTWRPPRPSRHQCLLETGTADPNRRKVGPRQVVTRDAGARDGLLQRGTAAELEQ